MLVDIGRGLAARATETGLEHAAAFNMVTMQPAGPLRSGNAAEVDVSDQLTALPIGHQHVVLHTHRLNTAPSDYDVDVLLSHDMIHTIVAVGHSGVWHILSKRSGQSPTGPATGVAAFTTALRQIAPHYLALVHRGLMTRENAVQALLHQAWRVVAPALGLRYDRSE